MDRSRYRVWATRLILIVVGLTVGFGLIGAIVWQRLTQDSASNTAATTPIKPNSSENSATTPSHPLDPVLELARTALKQHQSRDHDFTATLLKQERIGGKLVPPAKMEMKLRYAGQGEKRTVAVYMKFIEPKSQSGRELVWIQGENDNQLTVHETGFLNLTRIHLSPTSTLAMLGNRYPITEVGIEMLIKKLIEKGERDRELGDCKVEIEDGVDLLGRRCKRIEVTHEEPTVTIHEQQVAHEFYKAIIYIDNEWMLPIQYASYSWPKSGDDAPVLEEQYTYEDLRLNVGLADSDFDANNPAYNFPK